MDLTTEIISATFRIFMHMFKTKIDRRFKRLAIDRVNIFILLMAVVFLFARSKISDSNVYAKLFWIETCVILLPSILFIKMNGRSVNFTLALKSVTLSQIIFTLLTIAASYAMLVILNATMLSFLSRYFYIADTALPEAKDIGELLLGIIIIGIIPGICEECMYRGVVLNAYSKHGRTVGIFVSALLFAIFHFTIENFISPLILGIILGVILYRSGSIVLAIIGHAFSNTIAVCVSYFTYGRANSGDFESILSAMLSDLNLILVLGVLFLFSLVLVVIFVRKIDAVPKSKNVLSFEDGSEIETGITHLNTKSNIRGGSSIAGAVAALLIAVIFIYYNYIIYSLRLR